MQNLLSTTVQLEKYISQAELTNTNVSARSVAWHIDHCLTVQISIIIALQKSDAKKYQPSFNWKKTLIFILGKMPRGKAKAPKSVNPELDASKEALNKKIKEIEGLLQEFENFPKNSFFMHPFFGHLNKKKTLQFLAIHNQHHLKIIKDIVTQ
jgi:DinB superfamily